MNALFETEVIKEKVVFKMSSKGHQICHVLKIPEILKYMELEANIFRASKSL